MGLMERLVRIYDQLDEQLHAGYYFYIVIGVTKFITNSIFVYPCAMIMFGLWIPQLINYYEESQEDNKKEKVYGEGIS